MSVNDGNLEPGPYLKDVVGYGMEETSLHNYFIRRTRSLSALLSSDGNKLLYDFYSSVRFRGLVFSLV